WSERSSWSCSWSWSAVSASAAPGTRIRGLLPPEIDAEIQIHRPQRKGAAHRRKNAGTGDADIDAKIARIIRRIDRKKGGTGSQQMTGDQARRQSHVQFRSRRAAQRAI